MGFHESLFAEFVDEWARNGSYDAKAIIEHHLEALTDLDESKSFEWYIPTEKAKRLLKDEAYQMLLNEVDYLNSECTK
jgi:hypothetical protein